LLYGARYDLADLAAASSAVPGIFPPHRIDGRLYIDGGMWSATSVDAAAEAEEVIVVAPLAGPVMGPMGRTAGLLLGRELQTWRRRHPSKRITMIRPDHAIGRMAGRNPLGLFDADRARLVYPAALEQGRRWGDRQRVVDRRHPWTGRTARLRGVEGRALRTRSVAGRGAGSRRHPGQHGRSGTRPDVDDLAHGSQHLRHPPGPRGAP